MNKSQSVPQLFDNTSTTLICVCLTPCFTKCLETDQHQSHCPRGSWWDSVAKPLPHSHLQARTGKRCHARHGNLYDRMTRRMSNLLGADSISFLPSHTTREKSPGRPWSGGSVWSGWSGWSGWSEWSSGWSGWCGWSGWSSCAGWSARDPPPRDPPPRDTPPQDLPSAGPPKVSLFPFSRRHVRSFCSLWRSFSWNCGHGLEPRPQFHETTLPHRGPPAHPQMRYLRVFFKVGRKSNACLNVSTTVR